MNAYTFTLSVLVCRFSSILSSLYRALRGSLGLLDYWHGMEWQHCEKGTASWRGITSLEFAIEDFYKSITPYGKECPTVAIDWAGGIVTLKYEVLSDRKIKLGKVLARMQKSESGRFFIEDRFANETIDSIVQRFQTRKTEKTWGCVFTTHPSDVWGMSTNKGWTSCTRYGGQFHEGVYTDILSGNGVLYYFAPGKKDPSGREVLRAGVDYDGRPVIVRAGRIYGAGPEISDEELSNEFGVKVVTDTMRDYYCLTSSIYDDFERCCHQDGGDPERLKEAFATYLETPEANAARKAKREIARAIFEIDRGERIRSFKGHSESRSRWNENVKKSIKQNKEWFRYFRPGPLEMVLRQMKRAGATEAHRMTSEYRVAIQSRIGNGQNINL